MSKKRSYWVTINRFSLGEEDDDPIILEELLNYISALGLEYRIRTDSVRKDWKMVEVNSEKRSEDVTLAKRYFEYLLDRYSSYCFN